MTDLCAQRERMWPTVPLPAALDELLTEASLCRLRCQARSRGGRLRCSLDEGHRGTHFARFDDQTHRSTDVIAPIGETLEEPELVAASPTGDRARGHHLKHPGAWMPEIHVAVFDDEPDDWVSESLPEEDLLPWERARILPRT